MKVPNAGNAIIATEKLRDYLLNIGHRRGSAKARLLLSMGYRPDEWERLEQDLRDQHLIHHVRSSSQSGYGRRYDIIAPLFGPNGKSIPFCSVWQVDTGTDVPRFITMYPE
jgi:hypothetical protein